MTTPDRKSRKPGVMDAWPRFVLAAILSAAVHGGLLFGVIMLDGDGQGQRQADRSVPISVVSRAGSLVRSAIEPLGGQPSDVAPAAVGSISVPNTRQRPRRAQVARPPEPGLIDDPSTGAGTGSDVGANHIRPSATGSGSGTGSGTGVGANHIRPSATGTGSGSGSGSGTGSGTGTGTETGTGTGAGTGSGQATDVTAQRQYALDVRRLLERRGAYPGTARRLGLEGMVEMLLRIDSSGTIFEKRVLSSSGHPQLDRAALASADRLGRLPPPPSGQPVDIRVPVRFSMKRN